MFETIVNPVIRDEVIFIETAEATNGRISTLQVKLMPGGGTPLHYHQHFSEAFIVQEGVLTITLEGRKANLQPGEKYVVQARQWHRFSNESDRPVSFITIMEPGSAGFENALRILYGLASDNKTDLRGIPRNPLALAVVSKISDMHVAGPRFILVPLFAFFHFIAQISGYKRRLIRRYCLSRVILRNFN
ncbi:MAG TPA: cupin domain-containing protein [Flavihumibacter sp.]